MSYDHLARDGFGHWLAGFLDGEGHFYVTPNGRWVRCGLIVNIRADDAPVLEEIHDRLTIGTLTPYRGRGPANPQVRWEVGTKSECVTLVGVLDTFPLRAKKRTDYELWREAVSLWTQMSRGRGPVLMPAIKAIGSALRENRRYKQT